MRIRACSVCKAPSLRVDSQATAGVDWWAVLRERRLLDQYFASAVATGGRRGLRLTYTLVSVRGR